jgi:RNA-binding protein FUS
MVTQEDTIFVSGMDPSISEEEICQHFGAIGVIKVRIGIYRRHIYIYICTHTSVHKQI